LANNSISISISIFISHIIANRKVLVANIAIRQLHLLTFHGK